MNRALAAFFLLLAGCQLPPERLAVVAPLAEDGQPVPYTDLVTRARLQASAANEAFYVNRWSELEEAATSLEQTSRFLPKAADVPAKNKETLGEKSTALGKEAVQLKEAARTKDVKAANQVLQRINLQVRELRPIMDGK